MPLEAIEQSLIPIEVLGQRYAALHQSEELEIVDELVNKLAEDNIQYEEVSPYANSALTWADHLLIKLQEQKLILPGLKASSLAFAHYSGLVGGRRPDGVEFQAERSAPSSLFRDKVVLGFDKVVDSSETAVQAAWLMKIWGVNRFDQLTMVSKLTETQERDALGLVTERSSLLVGVRVPSDVWMVFSPQRTNIVEMLSGKLRDEAGMSTSSSQDIINQIMRPRNQGEHDEITQKIGTLVAA